MKFGEYCRDELLAEKMRLGERLTSSAIATVCQRAFLAWQAKHHRPAAATTDGPVVDPLFAALCTFEQVDPAGMTPDAKRKMAIALGQIRKASPDVTADEITRRGQRYLFLFKGITPTAHGLSANWARCWVKPVNTASAPVPIPVAAPEDRTPNFFSQLAREGGLINE